MALASLLSMSHSPAAATVCVACGAPLTTGVAPWHRRCGSCGYEAADLQVRINESRSHAQVDEAGRAIGLKSLRQRNFATILESLASLGLSPGAKVLEVGCAHGWFLEMAARTYTTLGIEPDTRICEQTLARGLHVRHGFFPDVVAADERFDAIVFNDVLEHIPDVERAVAACWRHLQPQGLLVVNLPSTRGVFYRLSRVLASLGLTQAFRRMWQVEFPSPHLHYFAPENLRRFVERHGYQQVLTRELTSVADEGLYERIAHTNDARRMRAWLSYAAVRASLPIVRRCPSDIMLSVFRKVGEDTSEPNAAAALASHAMPSRLGCCAVRSPTTARPESCYGPGRRRLNVSSMRRRRPRNADPRAVAREITGKCGRRCAECKAGGSGFRNHALYPSVSGTADLPPRVTRICASAPSSPRPIPTAPDPSPLSGGGHFHPSSGDGHSKTVAKRT